VSGPRVLVLAGLEPTGRAGLLADLETIRQLGGQGVGIATALTAQGRRTFALQPAPPAIIARQIAAALELGPIHAVKVGMIPARAVLEAARRSLQGMPWVVDPVTQTSRGEPLSRLRPRDYLALAGARVVYTPNLDEAGWTLQWPLERRLAWAERAGRALVERGFGAVVLKGGALRGAPWDVLVERGAPAPVLLRGARLRRSVSRHRGTGCRFASALAVELGRGQSLEQAARAAKAHVARYLGAP
jgi:hydroxymethylpyrimidine/phosphomethylpyrimidine kinase